MLNFLKLWRDFLSVQCKKILRIFFEGTLELLKLEIMGIYVRAFNIQFLRIFFNFFKLLELLMLRALNNIFQIDSKAFKLELLRMFVKEYFFRFLRKFSNDLYKFKLRFTCFAKL